MALTVEDDELIRRALLELGQGGLLREGQIRRLADQLVAVREIGPAALELEVERAERRLALLGVLSPYLTPPPGSWGEVLDRVPTAERVVVDTLLDGETVDELFS